MRFQRYSRRQDLLVGSLGSTLLLCTAVWLSRGTPVVASVSSPPAVVTYPSPQPPIEEPKPVDDPDQHQDNKRSHQELPDLPDIPRPVPPDIPQQPVELHIPNPNHEPVTHIDNGREIGSVVVNLADLDEAPGIRFQAKPQYPYSMKSQGLSGEVLVDFIVDPSGRVRDVTAVSSTHQEFESAAIAAVSKWKFKAGRKDGHAVFTHMQVPIDFSYDNASP